ncbi:hypothetical protein [Pontibacter cellulosilyticus]|uniref:Uncharacterized protein n=1 Tax=Pontibacter cellulosilyticus TaxID=1720253 RepID=A0A923SMP4_9BACT|nr:hypothetical protein [Pontibacter cellulosilyticus]MBC5992395.1 hypothetical protein [Pontibacter cellulosilyticus]
MNQQQDQLADLREIRNIMDRSSRFISLSGLSGVAAGVSALAGAAVVKWYFSQHNINYYNDLGRQMSQENILFVLGVAAAVLVLGFCAATYFTIRNTRKRNHRTWDNQSKRLLLNLAIPLATGGAFCAILIYHNLLFLVAPAMLVFYGLALLHSSKYTLGDIRYLGIIEIILGLIASIFVAYGLTLWTVGFGMLHIVYGALVYFKYER